MAIENNFGDAAIMGGVHSDSHDDNSVTNNYVNNTTNNSSVVNNSTVYAAQRTSIEISQDNEKAFLKAVQERFADGFLDKAELAELEQLSVMYHIPKHRTEEIIDIVRNSTKSIKGDNGNEFLTQQLLQEVFNAVQCNDINVVKRKLQPLKDVARYSHNPDVSFYHNMLVASLTPEVAAVNQINSRTDDYWQIYWCCVASTKLGNMDNASSLLYKLGNFGAPNGDIALLLAVTNIADYRRCNGQEYYKKQAEQYLNQAVQEGMSEQLSSLWYAAQSIIQDQTDCAEKWYKFYIDTTLTEFVCKKVVQTEKSANIQAPPPPMPTFNAQKVTLQPMQGFNALQAANNMGLGGMPQMPSMGGIPQMPSMGGMPQMPSMPSAQKCEEHSFTQESVHIASEVRQSEDEAEDYDDVEDRHGIILTNSMSLANKYNCEISKVFEIFQNFIEYANQQRMYWSFLDVAELNNNDSWECVNGAITQFMQQTNIAPDADLHLFIVGGDDVIPIPCVENPYENQINTPIPSDMCYCFEGRYILDIIEGENLPLTISAARNNVSRLPLENGIMSTTIEEDLMSYFNKSSLYQQGIPIGNVVMNSCADWIPASTTMSEHLPLTFVADDPELIKNGMYISPKLLTEDSDAIQIYSQSLTKADMLMFNLHGADMPELSGFYSSSEAFNISLLKCSNARVFNTVACYGARFMDYDRSQSMLLQAMYESGVLLYTGSLIPVPMYHDCEMNEARELLLNPGTGSEVFMRLYPLYQFKGMTAGKALLQAKCDYFNMCRHIESDGFSLATALMFSLYGNPMLHVCKRNHVVESALQNDAMPPAPVKSAKIPLRKTLKYEIANMTESRSLLEQLRAGVDANISAMHEITAEHLYNHFGLEPRHMYSIEQYSRPNADGGYEVGYMFNYHNSESYIASDVHVAVDGDGKVKRLYTNK